MDSPDYGYIAKQLERIKAKYCSYKAKPLKQKNADSHIE